MLQAIASWLRSHRPILITRRGLDRQLDAVSERTLEVILEAQAAAVARAVEAPTVLRLVR